MADTEKPYRAKKRVWALTKFDLEGIGGAAAAWLVGILLGWIWGPLFWLGAIAAIVILLATRSQKRTPPDLANLVVAPCDGIVHSIEKALPPTELRLQGGEWLRLRISSSPFASNPLHASITGEISSVIEEEPDRSVFTADHLDLPGLAVAHVTLESLGKQIGCTVATGGFGPRLEITSEAGDPVRTGRTIGKRRLGGWCDVYLDGNAKLLVSEGQTLVGAETVLCRLLRTSEDETLTEELPEVEATDAPETLEEVGQEALPEDDLAPLESTGEEPIEDAAETAGGFSVEDDDIGEPEDAVAELFKKLTDNETPKT